MPSYHELHYSDSQRGQRIFRKLAVSYTLLWLLEGAVRKWIPGTGDLFYVARDIFMLVGLIRLSLLRADQPANRWIRQLAIFLTTALLIYVTFQEFAGEFSNILIPIFGVRSYLAPLLLGVAAVMFGTSEAVRDISRVILIFGFPTLVVSTLQVLSSPESFINKAVSSDSAFFVQFGVARTTGFFASPAAISGFLMVGFALSLYSSQILKKPTTFKRLFLVSSFAVSIIISGARLNILTGGIVLLFFALREFSLQEWRALARISSAFTGLLLASGLVVYLLPNVLQAFQMRFADAANSEDSGTRLADQAFGYLATPFQILGDGIGNNSQAGISLGSGQPWVEWDASRWVVELGLLGMVMAILRSLVGVYLLCNLLINRKGTSDLRFAGVLSMAILLIAGEITQFPSNQAYCAILVVLACKWPKQDITL